MVACESILPRLKYYFKANLALIVGIVSIILGIFSTFYPTVFLLMLFDIQTHVPFYLSFMKSIMFNFATAKI